MNYWPRYIGDWKKKTSALSLLEKGVYTELLDYCYATESPIPLQIELVFRIVGARSSMEHRAVEQVLKMFFTKTGEGWENERVNEELSKWKTKSKKNAANAHKRWHKEPDQT